MQIQREKQLVPWGSDNCLFYPSTTMVPNSPRIPHLLIPVAFPLLFLHVYTEMSYLLCLLFWFSNTSLCDLILYLLLSLNRKKSKCVISTSSLVFYDPWHVCSLGHVTQVWLPRSWSISLKDIWKHVLA